MTLVLLLPGKCVVHHASFTNYRQLKICDVSGLQRNYIHITFMNTGQVVQKFRRIKQKVSHNFNLA